MKPNLEYTPADPSLEFPNSPVRARQAGSVPDIWGVVLGVKWLLLLGLIVGAACGQLVYMKLGPTYEAKARILVSKRTTAPIKDAETHGALGDRAEHVALIMSPLIVNEAIKKHNLDKLSTLAGKADVAEEILDSLRVRRSAGQDRSVLNVLDISYSSSKPGDAVQVVQSIIEAYRDYLAATRTEHTSETVELISQASRDLLKQLQEKESAYIDFRERAPLYWKNAPGTEGTTSDTTNVPQERMLAIEADRRTNLIKRAEVISKIKSLEQAIAREEPRETLEILVRRFLSTDGGGGNAAAGMPQAIADLQSQLLPLVVQEEKLLRDFGSDHPEVQTIRKSIRTIREFYQKQGIALPDPQKLAAAKAARAKDKTLEQTEDPNHIDFVQVYLTSLHQQLEELDIRDRELAVLFEDAAQHSKQYARYQVEDQALTGEIKRLKTLWEAIVNRLNELNLVKENQGFSLKQIAPTREGFVAKRQLRFIGVAAIFGMAVVFALAYLRAVRDTTLKSTDEIQQVFGMHLLGQVPHFRPLPARSAAAPRIPFDPDLRYVYQPGSAEAESYRSMRTALYFCLQGTGKVILVTSPEPQDGKTTTAANLALAVAHSGKRILLIDGDLRCPKIHKLFGMSRDIGLAEVLAGEIEFHSAIHETDLNRLSVLCAGAHPGNPAELLGSERFAQLIVDVRAQYDFVIIDAPPVLAVSDACVVAPQADGMLLVVRLGKTKRTIAQRAQELLGSHGIDLLGTIANDVSVSPEYGYGYGNSQNFPYNGSGLDGALANTVETPVVAASV